MTDFGATPTGFVRKRFEDILESISQRQLKSIGAKLKTKSARTVIGNLNNIFADDLSQAWEALEAAYYGFDPENAIDYLLTALCALTGVARLKPQVGEVPVTIVMDQSATFLPGTMVSHVAGETDNEWTNRETFVAAAAGTYGDVPFVSVLPGSQAIALSGSLTEISQTLTGWISITNPDDATPGRDLETFEELRIRRALSLSAQGSASLAAVVADIEKLDGVISARGAENVEDIPTAGLPPHSMRISVFAPALSNHTIAQRIHDAKWPGGIDSAGNTRAAIQDINGINEFFYFQRATEVPITIGVTVVSSTGFDAAVANAAVQIANASVIGGKVLIAKIIAAAMAVDGIDNVTSVLVDRGAGPVSTDLTMTEIEIATFALVDISVHT